jgi:hypothetical protein
MPETGNFLPIDDVPIPFSTPCMAVETLGQAHSYGWRVTARCAAGKQGGMKRHRECVYRAELASGRGAGRSRSRVWKAASGALCVDPVTLRSRTSFQASGRSVPCGRHDSCAIRRNVQGTESGTQKVLRSEILQLVP